MNWIKASKGKRSILIWTKKTDQPERRLTNGNERADTKGTGQSAGRGVRKLSRAGEPDERGRTETIGRAGSQEQSGHRQKADGRSPQQSAARAAPGGAAQGELRTCATVGGRTSQGADYLGRPGQLCACVLSMPAWSRRARGASLSPCRSAC